VREEIFSAFIRLVAHTPELQAYTASRLFTALKSDISQDSLTLAAAWVLGEYSEVLIETGIVEDDATKPVSHRFLQQPHTINIIPRSATPRSLIFFCQHWIPPMPTLYHDNMCSRLSLRFLRDQLRVVLSSNA
jgi:hypothetical protein